MTFFSQSARAEGGKGLGGGPGEKGRKKNPCCNIKREGKKGGTKTQKRGGKHVTPQRKRNLLDGGGKGKELQAPYFYQGKGQGKGKMESREKKSLVFFFYFKPGKRGGNAFGGGGKKKPFRSRFLMPVQKKGSKKREKPQFNFFF